MIESRFWRAELRADIRWLRKNQKIKRWSEKQLVLYERKLMLVAFQVRSLIDRPKVRQATRTQQFRTIKYPKVGDKPFTLFGPGWIHDRFDLSSPEETQLSVSDVCNQLIHYYVMTTSHEDGRFTSILIFSDYMRDTCAYEFEIHQLINCFSAFGDEASALDGGRIVWNEKKQDYVHRDL